MKIRFSPKHWQEAAIVLFTALFFLLSQRLQNVGLLGPLLILVMGGATAWTGAGAARALRLYLTVSVNQDVAIYRPEVPPALQPVVRALNALGFNRLGEYETRTPDNTTLGVAWCYLSADGQIVAETTVLGDHPFMQFTSHFEDGAELETLHPFGETINRPDYRVTYNTVDIGSAYLQHRGELEKFAAAHGAPRLMRYLRDFLSVMPEVRRRHGRRKLLRGVLQSVAFPLFTGLITLVVLVLNLFGEVAPQMALAVVMIGMNTAFALAPILLPARLWVLSVFWTLLTLSALIGAVGVLVSPPVAIVYLVGVAAALGFFLRFRDPEVIVT